MENIGGQKKGEEIDLEPSCVQITADLGVKSSWKASHEELSGLCRKVTSVALGLRMRLLGCLLGTKRSYCITDQ